MRDALQKILDRQTKHCSFETGTVRIKIFTAYANTVEGRQKLAESFLIPLRTRFDHKIGSFKDGLSPKLETLTRAGYTQMLRETDGLIEEANEFLALAYTPREKVDIAFRKLAALTAEIQGFRSEVASRC